MDTKREILFEDDFELGVFAQYYRIMTKDEILDNASEFDFYDESDYNDDVNQIEQVIKNTYGDSAEYVGMAVAKDDVFDVLENAGYEYLDFVHNARGIVPFQVSDDVAVEITIDDVESAINGEWYDKPEKQLDEQVNIYVKSPAEYDKEEIECHRFDDVDKAKKWIKQFDIKRDEIVKYQNISDDDINSILTESVNSHTGNGRLDAVELQKLDKDTLFNVLNEAPDGTIIENVYDTYFSKKELENNEIPFTTTIRKEFYYKNYYNSYGISKTYESDWRVGGHLEYIYDLIRIIKGKSKYYMVSATVPTLQQINSFRSLFEDINMMNENINKHLTDRKNCDKIKTSNKAMLESLDYGTVKDLAYMNPVALGYHIRDIVGDDMKKISVALDEVLNSIEWENYHWNYDDDEMENTKSKYRDKALSYIGRQIKWDKEHENNDPMLGHKYKVYGTRTNVVDTGYDSDYYGGNFYDTPKSAIVAWLKISQKAPTETAIYTNKNKNADELLAWVDANRDEFIRLCDKYNCPYKPDYMIYACNRGNNHDFERNKYGYEDQIHPFSIG